MIQRSPSRIGPRGEAGEVGAGAGLAEQLAPADLALEDRRDVAGDLVGRAVREDRRRGHEQAEAAGRPQRAVLGERRRARSPATRRAARGRPARAVKCGAVQPASATMRHHSSTARSGSQCSSSQRVTSSRSSSFGRRSSRRRSRRAASEQLEAVVAHDLAAPRPRRSRRAPSRSRAAAARPSPCGQSEPNRMRSTPMRSASAREVLLAVRRDPHVAADRVERVLGEHPRRLVGLLLQPLHEQRASSRSRSRCWRRAASGGG